jgi:hypothetical protein
MRTTKVYSLAMVLSLALLLPTCTGKDTKGGSCQDNGDCAPGEVCDAGACLRLCSSDYDCTVAGTICDGDRCVPGSRGNAPIITGVDGDGDADSDPTHVPHRYDRALTISGSYFDGARVTLSGVGDSWLLEVCSATSAQLTVALPEGLVSGASYTLTVATQAGECNAVLPVLQGERPVIATNGGLTGDGTPGSPLAVDFTAHTHPANQITGTLTMGQLPTAGIQALVDATLSSPATPTRLMNGSVTCGGANDGVTWFDAAARLVFACSGGVAVPIGGQGFVGCREILAAHPGSASGTYWITADGSSAHALQVYCDMTTDRFGSVGWILLAVVSNNDAGFWNFTAAENAIFTSKGTADPTAANYLLAIEWWRRLTKTQRDIVAEITTTSTSYSLVYPNFQLDEGYRYRHMGTATWQHNDGRNHVTFYGDLYPYVGSYAGNCGQAGIGWWGACGYSQFYQQDGANMMHPTNAAGSYVQVTGVTKKRYWMQ